MAQPANRWVERAATLLVGSALGAAGMGLFMMATDPGLPARATIDAAIDERDRMAADLGRAEQEHAEQIAELTSAKAYLASEAAVLRDADQEAHGDEYDGVRDGFAFSAESITGDHRLIGKIKNQSGKNYSLATFQANFYDEDARLIDVKSLMVQNFRTGTTKTFALDLTAEDLDADDWEFAFESGL